MYTSYLCLLAVPLLGTAVLAQNTSVIGTPPGFSPAVTDILELYVRDTTIDTPGASITIDGPAFPPGISSTGIYLNGTFLLTMVDIDAPDPSNPIYAQYIHWLQPGITFAFQPPGPYPGMTNNSAPVIPYRRPTPPNYSQAHRYVFLLYNQPDDFAVPADFPFNATSRANFNDTSFAEEMGLGAPLMANWYSCSNYTGAAPPNSTTTAGASTGTAAATKTSNGTALATATPSVSASRTASGGSAIATGSAALANTVQSVAFSVGLVVVVAMMM